jgi:SAM-dependent methyltransferase
LTEFADWDAQTKDALEAAYVAAGAGPRGAGSSSASEGEWRAKRQHLTIPMDAHGSWLEVGCANGHLLATLPSWTAERGVTVTAHGLELLPPVAALARSLHLELADRIWTGSVMSWQSPMRFRFVTATTDVVPPTGLRALISKLLADVVAPGGRLILSAYANVGEPKPALFEDLELVGHPADGVIHIDRPGRAPLLTAWLDNAE